MTQLRHHLMAAGGMLALITSAAFAQDTKKPPPTEFASDLGFVNVSGNTSVTTLNVGERLLRRLARWELKQDFGLVYGETDGKESSNSWRTSLRGDYGVSDRFAFYARTTFDRNKFAGIKSRFSEGVGAVQKLLVSDIDQLSVEAGLEVTQQQDLDGSNNNFSAARGAMVWKHAFTKAAYFFQAVEVLPNLDNSKDLRMNTESTIVAPLSAHVGIKVSYLVRYDNEPALNATRTAPLLKSDRILSTGIQISF